MKLLGSVIVLGCNDVERALDFYQQALQFVIIKQRKSKQGLDWVYLRSGDALLMLEQRQATSQQRDPDDRIYFYCDDTASLHHFLRARSIQVSNLRETDYSMQEFDIIDPDGHKLTIGQQITEN